MRRPVITSLLVLSLAACGSHKSKNVDAPGGGGGGGGDAPGDSISGNPTTITVTLTNHPNTPATYSFLVAYQDGAGAWTLAPAPTGDVYTFTVNSPAWGFAWTCVPANVGTKRVELAYFSVAEKTTLSENIPRECSDRYPADASEGGTVTNLPTAAGTYAAVYADRRTDVTKTATAGVFPPAGGMFRVPPGNHDLVIAHVTFVAGTSATVNDLAIVRGSAPSTTATVDYSTSKAMASFPVTFGSTPPNGSVISTTLYTAGGTTLVTDLLGANATSFVSLGLDPSLAATGDMYDQSITEPGVTVENWTPTLAAQSYTAPTALGGQTSMEAGTTPYPTIKSNWGKYNNATGYVWTASQGTGVVPALRWRALIGPTYIGATPQWQMPDLSTLTGWSNTSWAFATGNASVDVAALTSTAGATDFPPVVPAISAVVRAIAFATVQVTL